MHFNEFENKLQNNNESLNNKSYYQDDKWKTSRCRIDVCFWAELILDLIIKENSINDINEYYLTATRNITQNWNETYNNSHNMDINAICKWLNINKNFKLHVDNENDHNMYIEYIIKYIDNIICSRNYKDKFTHALNELKNQDLNLDKINIDNQNTTTNICAQHKWILSDDNYLRQEPQKIIIQRI